MANQRLYIKNNKTGETVFFAKYFPGSWFRNESEKSAQQMNAFLKKIEDYSMWGKDTDLSIITEDELRTNKKR